ncbi:MAG: hypothetical protein K8S23_07900 [Candidatus Cloacimonetes bacterium]|nr:hypothetical protein [Candidatus Cloacimonadota bacterium]
MRKNIVLVLFIFGIIVHLVGQVREIFPASGPFVFKEMYKPQVIDARSEALGGTSILSSTGGNFVFNNPALLSNLSQKNIQLGSRAIYGKEEYKHNNDNYNSDYPMHYKLNGLSFGMPLKFQNFKFGIGAGYRTYYDLGKNRHYEDQDSDYVNDHFGHGGLSTLVLGGGFNFQNIFFIGFSSNLPFFSKYSKEVESIDSYGDEYKYKTESTLKGTFFTIGSSYKLNKVITFGLRLRTGFSLEWKEKDSGNEENLIVPPEFGLALELKPIPSLKFYTEWLTRNFSKYKMDNNNDEYYLYDDLGNGFALRTGFEAGTNWLFRGGFFMQSLPIYESKNADDGEVVKVKTPKKEYGFTTGLGFKIYSKISVDFFSVYSFLTNNQSYYDPYWGLDSTKYFTYQMKIGSTIGYNF